MEVVWGAVLSFLFVLATLYGYGAGTPQLEKKDKAEQSDKKDEEKKDEEKKKDESKKSDESGKGKSQTKGKSQKNKGTPAKASKEKAEYCIKDCPEAWRIPP
jgi:hypothetical protein